MTTRTSRLDRIFDWFLDHDGDIYGDEQERQRWYEAIAVVASLQWIVLPWLAVVCLAVWGRPVAPAVLVLLVGLYLPMFLANAYVTRRHVRTVPERWSRKRIAITVASMLPYVVLVGQFFWVWQAPRSELAGSLVGAVVGIAVAFTALQMGRRRRRARELDPEDLD